MAYRIFFFWSLRLYFDISCEEMRLKGYDRQPCSAPDSHARFVIDRERLHIKKSDIRMFSLSSFHGDAAGKSSELQNCFTAVSFFFSLNRDVNPWILQVALLAAVASSGHLDSLVSTDFLSRVAECRTCSWLTLPPPHFPLHVVWCNEA